jgi:hypothetical protein
VAALLLWKYGAVFLMLRICGTGLPLLDLLRFLAQARRRARPAR